ncbi:endophilin-B1-like isoform X1 [Nerophis ophidion]|uniref:endophilin-B1-like isoform X1 n=1 Tax=Nerophis ophidion TaxID=159077 RepID=UPI002AE0ABD1|nr:endophilin-B1-like isoform X1 [Nerophis ophidion]
MDLTQLAVDAGQFINRAVQYTEESLGQADKTELKPELEELLTRADATKTWTDNIVSQTEAMLQPSLAARLEDRLYEHLDWPRPLRPHAHQVLGEQMIEAGFEMGNNTPYGRALLRCGEAQKQFGEAQRHFVQSANIHFVTPLQHFTNCDYKVIQEARRMLLNKRLDLDVAKSRLRRSHLAHQESTILNNTRQDDYMSFMFRCVRVGWLKMWAQEVSQAEVQLRMCQSSFDRQSDVTQQLLGELHNTHKKHMQSLIDFVDAQTCFYAHCKQHALELRKHLASIPAVLCSSQWQSSITNELINTNDQQRASILVPHLPDLERDSCTLEVAAEETSKSGPPSPEQSSKGESETGVAESGMVECGSVHGCQDAAQRDGSPEEKTDQP